ncbi:hypothetical protein DFH06DRAFT_1134226 [Mycena polygramma]|nr:hypothetical protein DFH06DRAFT_1134226 [Mycena polygramma]
MSAAWNHGERAKTVIEGSGEGSPDGGQTFRVTRSKKKMSSVIQDLAEALQLCTDPHSRCNPPSGRRTEIRIFRQNPPSAGVCSPRPVKAKSAAIIGQIDHRKCLFILHRLQCCFAQCHPPSGRRTEIRIFLQNPPPARVCSPPLLKRKSAAIIDQIDHRKCLFILQFWIAIGPPNAICFKIHLEPWFALQQAQSSLNLICVARDSTTNIHANPSITVLALSP